MWDATARDEGDGEDAVGEVGGDTAATRRGAYLVPQEGNFRQIAPSPPAGLVGCTRLSILHADLIRVGRQHAKQARWLRGASGLLRPRRRSVPSGRLR